MIVSAGTAAVIAVVVFMLVMMLMLVTATATRAFFFVFVFMFVFRHNLPLHSSLLPFTLFLLASVQKRHIEHESYMLVGY
jgi:hypothetical protein